MKPMTDNYDLQRDMARKLFCTYDHEKLIRKFRLDAVDDWILLTYLNTPFRISRLDGHVEEWKGAWTECRTFATVMTLYDLLCYSEGDAIPPLTGQWCTVGNFIVTGITDTEGDTRQYAAFCDGRMDQFRAACATLGGTTESPLAGADLTCRFAVTPFFPLLLQFWAGDDEFPPKLLVMWDRNSDRFLRFETTFYLQGDLLARLKQAMEDPI